MSPPQPIGIPGAARRGVQGQTLAAYKKLYEIEAEIRDRDPSDKLVEREKRSKPVWNELVAWCTVHKKHEQPSSPLGVALWYFTNHQVALGRFLEYGYVPMDNGIVERLHVRAALTRKNFLFAGADSGGDRAAIAYTILGSCRLAGVNPIEYLSDVLPKLARRFRLMDLPSLLPSRWVAARAAAHPTCAWWSSRSRSAETAAVSPSSFAQSSHKLELAAESVIISSEVAGFE